MDGFVKLTDYDSGRPVLVRLETIRSMRELSPFHDDGQEEGARTRIDTQSDMFLVKESIEYIQTFTEE